jgi:dihydrofolate reductase
VRQLIVTEFMSLDGVVDSPGGGPHPHAGWTFTDVEFDEAAYELKGREQEEAGAMLLGRVSYEEFAPVWKTMAEFERYNAMPKYVVSTSLHESDLDPEWAPTTILTSLEDVAALKDGEGGPVLLHGSAELAQNLAAAGLVDRYHLLVFPVVLGSGRRLFVTEGGDKQRLELVEHATYGNGVRMAVYDVVR